MLAPLLYRKADRQLYAQREGLVINVTSIIIDLKYSSPVSKGSLHGSNCARF